MPADVILGLQWGDEGKGKIVDALAGKYDIVARFQGGPNAGHTLKFNGNTFVLHTIPSGIFQDRPVNLIGNGVVIDPVTFKKEVEQVEQTGLDLKKKLLISKKAHLILPTHKILDAASEASKGKSKIGSTLKGIGPAYMDKTGRNGLRIGDILSDDFKSRYDKLKEKHLRLLQIYDYNEKINELEDTWFEGIELLRQMQLSDSEYYINKQLQEGKHLLAEGAQGSLLDIDIGTYPYVTSSNTITAGVCNGLGIAPHQIREVTGVAKAYCTRVGSGPFPTELHDKTGERLQKAGNEFGATTGRPRRCGWIDLVALHYSMMINGVTQLAITKADVLNGFEEIKVAEKYKTSQGETDQFPFDIVHETIEPVYRNFSGWMQSLEGISSFENLPKELVRYLEYLEGKLNVPVTYLSTGPDRTELITSVPEQIKEETAG